MVNTDANELAAVSVEIDFNLVLFLRTCFADFLATCFGVALSLPVDCCVFVSASVFSVVPVGVLESFSVVTESLESF